MHSSRLVSSFNQYNLIDIDLIQLIDLSLVTHRTRTCEWSVFVLLILVAVSVWVVHRGSSEGGANLEMLVMKWLHSI